MMLTPTERADILNAINETFKNKNMPYEVCGYDDTDNVFLNVLIDRKEDLPEGEYKIKVGDQVMYTRCVYDHQYGWIGTVQKVRAGLFIKFDNGECLDTQEENVIVIGGRNK